MGMMGNFQSRAFRVIVDMRYISGGKNLCEFVGGSVIEVEV